MAGLSSLYLREQWTQHAAAALRIPVWNRLEDRPGKERDFQSDSGHATD
jgi:hypothetical protein